MSIITFNFVLFFFISCSVYYLLPGKFQWMWLLASSLFFCATADPRGLIFLFGVSAVTYVCGKAFLKIQNNEILDKKSKKAEKKKVVTRAIVVLIGVLVVLKCTNTGITFINYIVQVLTIDWNIPFLNVFIPMGISYYTLQAVSYLMDAYWGRVPVETSFLKLLTYLGFFPLLVQGPISRFGQLSPELFSQHTFSGKNVKFGLQLVLWGYFKKMVIADRVADYVGDVFYSSATPYGVAVFFGLAVFGIQLYCDFSGGIDVIRGVSQCYGIEVAQNFNQPFFSKSLGEFWRRWHISLGAWMKDYVFYPVSMSKPMTKLKKWMKEHTSLSKKFMNKIPMAISYLVVFALTGIWHGTGSKYLGWGLYNGIILAAGVLLDDVFSNTKATFGVKEESLVWKAFCLMRTYMIVTIGWVFDCADSAWEAIKLFVQMLMVWKTDFSMVSIPKTSLAISGLSVLVLLCVSIAHEKNISVRELMHRKGYFTQVLVWTMLFQLVACFAYFNILGGDNFLYANF